MRIPIQLFIATLTLTIISFAGCQESENSPPGDQQVELDDSQNEFDWETKEEAIEFLRDEKNQLDQQIAELKTLVERLDEEARTKWGAQISELRQLVQELNVSLNNLEEASTENWKESAGNAYDAYQVARQSVIDASNEVR